MKIAVVTFGSRGDLEPPLALAERLVAADHDVRIALPTSMAETARRIGCSAVSLPGEAQDYFTEPELFAAMRRGDTRFFLDKSRDVHAATQSERLQLIGRAFRGVDLVICHAFLEQLAVHFAELHRVRLAFMHCYPIWPNDTYPAYVYSARRLPRLLNRLSFFKRTRGPWLRFRGKAPPFFYWVPPEILPPPAEYGDNHHFTGSWRASPVLRAALGEQELPIRVVEFLARGARPLFVTFGSLPILDPRVVDLFIGAARAMGLRVLFGKGGSSVEVPETDDVSAVASVDHDALLPRCLAVVHHGGASTTAAGLRAGIPSVVIPVLFDQMFWGRRVCALGVGAVLPFRKLDEPRLTRVLERALRPEVCERAALLAARLAALPDGATVAARIIGEQADRFPIPGGT